MWEGCVITVVGKELHWRSEYRRRASTAGHRGARNYMKPLRISPRTRSLPLGGSHGLTAGGRGGQTSGSTGSGWQAGVVWSWGHAARAVSNRQYNFLMYPACDTYHKSSKLQLTRKEIISEFQFGNALPVRANNRKWG